MNMNAEVAPGRLSGRNAIVTGGGSGIGAAVALAFVRAGATVTMCDLTDQGMERTQAALADDPAAAARLTAVVCDVRDRSQVTALLDGARQRSGPIDVVASIAGTAWYSSLHEMTDDDYDNLMDVHVRAAFHFLRGVVDEFCERRSGKFITVTSPAAVRGQVNGTIYSAAKSALIGIVRSAALELGPYNVQVNAVLPDGRHPDDRGRDNTYRDQCPLPGQRAVGPVGSARGDRRMWVARSGRRLVFARVSVNPIHGFADQPDGQEVSFLRVLAADNVDWQRIQREASSSAR